jgi:hypothetical protein
VGECLSCRGGRYTCELSMATHSHTPSFLAHAGSSALAKRPSPGAIAPPPASELHTDELDENGARVMNKKAVQRILRQRGGAYTTPAFNSTLYLNSERI